MALIRIAKTLILMALLGNLVVVSSAQASGGIWCEGLIDKEKFYLSISTGRSHVLAVLNAQISIGENHWATQPENGETEIIFGQGMTEGTKFATDFVDANHEKILFGLRVDFDGIDESVDDTPFVGQLTLNETRTVAVDCHGGG
ncbi:MAG: hypothetical protein GKR97_20595 [Rhizobiaceae bacterium]|nr:hypothetical protein [Rhizobiaceae bacterium]